MEQQNPIPVSHLFAQIDRELILVLKSLTLDVKKETIDALEKYLLKQH